PFAPRARDAEVEELDREAWIALSGAHDEEGRGLHVAMDEPRVVERREAERGLRHDVDDLALRQPARALPLREILPVEPLEDEVREPRVIEPVGHMLDHTRVVEAREQGRLALEPLERARLGEVLVEPLDSD